MVLLYGFEPFGNRRKNSSWEMLKDLKDKEVRVLKLPVSYDNPAEELLKVIDEEKPDLVLGFGQLDGVPFPVFERIGVNWIDSKYKDNSGKIIHDKPIIKDAPVAYFTTVPNKRIIRALNEREIETKMSQYLTLYVCNQVLYELLNHVETENLKTKAGHVHVPPLPGQVEKTEKNKGKVPTVPLKDLKRFLEATVKALKTI